MSLLTALLEALAALFGARQTVRPHTKRQAYAPGWSKHRPRWIQRLQKKAGPVSALTGCLPKTRANA